MEIWKQSTLNPKYEVSNFGNIKGKRGLLKCSLINKNKTHPYKYFQTQKNGERINHLVHRCVATEFCLKEDETKTDVDHIDHNTLNNHYTNLRWTTHKENMENHINYRHDIPKENHNKLLHKEWWDKNKDRINKERREKSANDEAYKKDNLEKANAYYAKNRKKILEKRKIKKVCCCGATYTGFHLKRHQQTPFHQEYMKSISPK